MEVLVETAGLIYRGEQVRATVTWRNLKAAAQTPRFRLDIKGITAFGTWQEGNWMSSTSAPAGATGQLFVDSIAVPSNWSVGTKISLQLVVEGIEGAVWGAGLVPPSFGSVETFIVGAAVDVAIVGVVLGVKGR